MEEYYDNYPSFITDLNQKEITLRSKLQSLNEAILNQKNTVDLEIQIPDILTKFKDILDKLDEAYLPENAKKNISKKILINRQNDIKIQKSRYEELNKRFQDLVIKRHGSLENYMKAKYELEKDETLIDLIEEFFSDIYSLNGEIEEIKSNVNDLKIINDKSLNEININKIQNDINDIDNSIDKIENNIKARGNLENLRILLIKISEIKKSFVDIKSKLGIKKEESLEMIKLIDNFEKAHINSKKNKEKGKNDEINKLDEIKGDFVHENNLELGDLRMIDDIINNIKAASNNVNNTGANTKIKKKTANNNQTRPSSKIFIEDKIDYDNIDNNKNNINNI